MNRHLVRHCDVAVIGGSAAGLAAALQLGRQRRSVIVIDSGEPRNAPAAHMHSFLGHDGTPPAELLDAGRADVRSYGGEVLAGQVVEVGRTADRFAVEVAETGTVVARRIVVTTGLRDELPEIEGLADHWGEEVIHCPFCHGYEVRDQQVVHLVTHPMGLHVAPLLRQLTARLTVLVDQGVDVDQAQLDTLRAAGVQARTATAERVLRDAGGRLSGLGLSDGSRIDAQAVLIGPRFRPRAEPFAQLGLRPEPHASGLGEVLAVDLMGATSVAGVFAAGNITDPSQQVLQAAAHGSRVGGAVAVDLATEDVRATVTPSAVAADWDRRYDGEPVWSGNPNGSLVAEVARIDAVPGRALDVGAGEGGDALWLAEQGWDVTASDISPVALAKAETEARRRGLRIATHVADARGWEPFERHGFDLVTAAYASIPRTPDLRAVENILAAVAPGGTLIALGHDPNAMRRPEHAHRLVDPDAYMGIDDLAAVLERAEGWTIEVHERRARPAGSVSDSHHTDDEVLRARRAR